MQYMEFLKTIHKLFEEKNKIELETYGYFLFAVTTISNNDKDSELLKMTKICILFEGYYSYLVNTKIKSSLLSIKNELWFKNYGVPTIAFLLTHKKNIEETKLYFEHFSNPKISSLILPWDISIESFWIADEPLDVLVNPQIINEIIGPAQREITGVFTKTHNPFGGFTTAPCDLISQKFINQCECVAKDNGRVLEVGAAYGAATIEALSHGVNIFCNDISAENLAVVNNRYIEFMHKLSSDYSKYTKKLVLVPGEFPNDLNGLPKNFFDAILICRVMHFFTGEEITHALYLVEQLLKPGGKVYIVCETPFLKNWQKFLPEFYKRQENNIEWPGEITNPIDFESSGRAASLPKFVHWITKDILERSLQRAGFLIEEATYIDRKGQFPEDLLFDGRESVGAIAVKVEL